MSAGPLHIEVDHVMRLVEEGARLSPSLHFTLPVGELGIHHPVRIGPSGHIAQQVHRIDYTLDSRLQTLSRLKCHLLPFASRTNLRLRPAVSSHRQLVPRASEPIAAVRWPAGMLAEHRGVNLAGSSWSQPGSWRSSRSPQFRGL